MTLARHSILTIWLAFLLVDLGLILYLYFDDWIEDDTLWLSLSQLNTVYVTYLGVMIAFYFAGHNNVHSLNRRALATLVVAIIASLSWNSIVTSFIVKAFVLRGNRTTMYGLEDSVKQISKIGPLLSWLVAPCIGYYFGISGLNISQHEDKK